jgi:predicted transposase YbfD/YdcC
MARPSKRRFELEITQINYIKKLLGINKIEDVDKAAMKRLKNNLKAIKDIRVKGKTKFKIWDIIICSILAVLFGAQDWEDIHDFVDNHHDWLREFLLLTGGIPCAKTYERVFAIIDSHELEDILNDFIMSFNIKSNLERDIINLDGRVNKGSSRKETIYSEKIKPLNVLNAYSNKYGVCLASEMIEDKSNEIPTIPEILKRFKVKGNIITWDALNTQVSNVEAVIGLKGDYVVPIKGNQGNFYNDLIDYFDEKKLETIKAGNSKSAYLDYYEKRGCQSIHYEYFQTTDVKWYSDIKKWKKLNSIGVVKKTIDDGKEIKIEMRYYISSLFCNIILFSSAIRNHWSVENKLHWHLDFTFKQDNNTTSNKLALLNLEIINKFCLAILNRVKPFYNNISLKRIRKRISYNFEKSLINLMCYLSLS